MSNMEEYNYWGDARVREGMINRGKVIEEGGRRYIVLGEDMDADEEDWPGPIKLLCRWEVCGMCNGNGTHTNPSIDCGGLSADDFDRDPGFADDYRSGMYDVQCSRCKGKRVEPGIDRDCADPEMLKRYDDWMTEEYNSAAESAAERQMGA